MNGWQVEVGESNENFVQVDWLAICWVCVESSVLSVAWVEVNREEREETKRLHPGHPIETIPKVRLFNRYGIESKGKVQYDRLTNARGGEGRGDGDGTSNTHRIASYRTLAR